MSKKTLEEIKTLEALVNVYKDQPDNLVNKIWAWHKRINKGDVSQSRKEVVEECMELVGTHTEHNGDYCDTGSDMEWVCRSECVRMAIDRLLKLTKPK